MNGDQSHHQDSGDKAPPDTSLQERALRNLFVSLRQEEQQSTPAFASLWARKNPVQQRKGLWFAAAACCAVIVVAAFLLLRSERPNREEVLTVSITEWKAPTDFLLETPGREILRTVPEIGKWQRYTVSTAAEDGHSQARKKVLH